MNSRFKVIIFAFAAVLVFSSTACGGGGGGGGGKSLNSTEELKAYLDEQPANSFDNSEAVTMNVNDQTIRSVFGVLNSAGKYVNLYLTGNDLTIIPANAFFNERMGGCLMLTAITIPDSVIRITALPALGITLLMVVLVLPV